MLIILNAIIPLVLLGISAGFALHAFRQRRQTRRISMITKPLAELDLSLAFDPDHAILWDTQVPALELIAMGNCSGIRKRGLLLCYRALARSYPELYEGSTFEQWLEHLEEAHLIVCGGHRILLAAEGRAFLRCRITVPRSSAMQARTS